MKRLLILFVIMATALMGVAQTLDAVKTLGGEREKHLPLYTYWNFDVSEADTVYAGNGDSIYYVGVNVNKHNAVNGGWWIDTETLAGDQDSLKVTWTVYKCQFHTAEEAMTAGLAVPNLSSTGNWTQNNDNYFVAGDSINSAAFVPTPERSNYRSEILKIQITQIGAADTFVIRNVRYKAYVLPGL